MTVPSIGVAATFRDECNALSGFLEMASQFFDGILLVDCSPGMTPSTDGSLDIIRKWGLPDPPLWDLSSGFGAIRSQLLHTSKTDWTVILDIDERLHVTMPLLICKGTENFPAVERPDLSVEYGGGVYNQRQLLERKIMQAETHGIKTVRFRRRHWFDMSFNSPTQNWQHIPDWQLRCMKSRSSVGYTIEPKMHERAWDTELGRDPEYVEEDPLLGPFIEHHHCHFKPMEPEQRKADIAAYDALHFSTTHTPIPA